MSHYKPYPAYKDSGEEWLARVPEHWQVKQLKYLASHIGSGKTPSGGAEVYQDAGVLFLRSQNVYEDGLRLDDAAFISDEVDEEMKGSRVMPGDVLLNITGASIGRSCQVPEVFERANVNQHVCIIRGEQPVDSKWISLCLPSKAVQAQIDFSQNGAGREGLNFQQIGNMFIALPHAKEVDEIASRLDHETARIDALIEKKTRFIEMLREKRQALIINAVTKGLDPNVRMKDSGVEWLGEVPEHWSVLQLRHTARLESGHTPSRSKPEYWVDCTVPWFTLADVWQVRSGEQKYVSETSEKISQLGLENSSARLLPAGSVFLSRTASVGFPGIMAVDMATSQDFAVWTCTSELFNEYLYYVLLGMKPDFDRLMMGSTHKTIYMPDIEAIRLARPPLDEQRGIVSALSGQLGRFKIVINKTERSIELLKERRSALITAAVTGQIDLRTAV
ncbi:restriction endonuclease subunit S [Pseudomonas sp. NFPP19]|uniref:restriction endonuclease subunit S n=1 Tax=Pseudomonas sp. NFPP19 TaxID=1566225 RepID=UPI0008AABD67|nr:restriction endonuclease subunit S [Pseudomonas sp. NFPP19]SEQ49243.1 type I restriction enzyme, S subunit [Pseudomonas sp. NFPP19]